MASVDGTCMAIGTDGRSVMVPRLQSPRQSDCTQAV